MEVFATFVETTPGRAKQDRPEAPPMRNPERQTASRRLRPTDAPVAALALHLLSLNQPKTAGEYVTVELDGTFLTISRVVDDAIAAVTCVYAYSRYLVGKGSVTHVQPHIRHLSARTSIWADSVSPVRTERKASWTHSRGYPISLPQLLQK